MVEIIVGALIAIATTFGLNWWTNCRNERSLKWALAAEITSVIGLVRSNRYIELLLAHATILQDASQATPPPFIIAAQTGYFTVYESSAANLGSLTPGTAAGVVAFYQGARSFLDSVSKDNEHNWKKLTRDEAAQAALELASLLDVLRQHGEELVRRLGGAAFRTEVQKAWGQELGLAPVTPIADDQPSVKP